MEKIPVFRVINTRGSVRLFHLFDTMVEYVVYNFIGLFLFCLVFFSVIVFSTHLIDSDEVEFFNKFSKEWWDVDGPLRGLHMLNNVRVPYMIEELRQIGRNSDAVCPLSGLKILDVGCGGGILAEALAKLGGDVTAIDPAVELIKIAKDHAKQQQLNIEYLGTSVQDFCMENKEKFDLVVVPEVLEHVTEKASLLSSCCECLKRGGSIFVSAFNKTYASWLVVIILWEHVFGTAPKGCHDWNKFISPEDTSQLLSDCKFLTFFSSMLLSFVLEGNCDTVSVKGMFQNVITNNWYLIDNLSTQYDVHAVKK